MYLFTIICLFAFLASAVGCDSGARGPQGATGARGPAGVDGSSITVVPLCPGVTSYPSTYVELALCIDSRLYAIYSSHGGLLVELVPGAYSSNAINSACNLTVAANCQVLH